jgi:trehalose/maltose transport system permease protein
MAYYVVVGLTLFYVTFPIYWMLLSSFRSPNTVFTVNYFPTNLTTLNYRLLSIWEEFIPALQNSIVVAGGVLLITLGLGAVAAYALGRIKFRGRRLTRYAVLFMTAFPQIAVIGGLYQLISNPCTLIGAECRNLTLYNTRISLIVSTLILTLPLAIWFLAVYYRSLPQDIEDAAYVDGATPFQTFTKIFLPLSIPGLLTVGLISFIVAWNEYMFAITFTIDERARTAPVVIGLVGGLGSLTDLAAAVIVTLPVVALAVLLRRQLTTGLSGFVSPTAATRSWQRASQSAGNLRQGGQQDGHRFPGFPATTGGAGKIWNIPGWLRQKWQQVALVQLNLPLQLLLLMVGLTLLGYAGMVWQTVSFPYPLDYGEGPLLAQTVQLANLENIYRPNIDTPPYTITNYPPLFMLLQVPLKLLVGPAFWYGRLLSVVSALVASLFVGLILHSLTGDVTAAVVGGLLLLANPYLEVWSVLNRIDTLALALSMAGLWLLVRQPYRRPGFIAGALLLVAAVYTRQSYGLAAPLAAFVWLLRWPQRRRALILAALVGGVGLGLFILLNLLTAGGFFFNTVTANANAFEFERLYYYWEESLWHFMPYLVVGSLLFVTGGLWFRIRWWWLIAPYFVGAALSAATIGKVGSNINYLLELSAAFALALGGLLAWQKSRPRLRQAVLLLLALQVYLLLPGIPNHLFILGRAAQPKEMARLMAIVEQSDGLVLADDAMGYLPLDQRALYVQPFEVSQLANDGVWDQSAFVASIKRQEFATIVILRVMTPQGALEEDNWTAEMLAAIKENYRQVDLVANNTFVYEPR